MASRASFLLFAATLAVLLLAVSAADAHPTDTMHKYTGDEVSHDTAATAAPPASNSPPAQAPAARAATIEHAHSDAVFSTFAEAFAAVDDKGEPLQGFFLLDGIFDERLDISAAHDNIMLKSKDDDKPAQIRGGNWSIKTGTFLMSRLILVGDASGIEPYADMVASNMDTPFVSMFDECPTNTNIVLAECHVRGYKPMRICSDARDKDGDRRSTVVMLESNVFEHTDIIFSPKNDAKLNYNIANNDFFHSRLLSKPEGSGRIIAKEFSNNRRHSKEGKPALFRGTVEEVMKAHAALFRDKAEKFVVDEILGGKKHTRVQSFDDIFANIYDAVATYKVGMAKIQGDRAKIEKAYPQYFHAQKTPYNYQWDETHYDDGSDF